MYEGISTNLPDDNMGPFAYYVIGLPGVGHKNWQKCLFYLFGLAKNDQKWAYVICERSHMY